ncbi:MAG: hypothetical protein H0U23_05730 [Blastocatellia bacterium]|nr:hypothetical protein [Blastocatellia bacterium]
MKLPWCKFYPRDWIGDAELRSLGYAARGLWADMLCLMYSGKRTGYLVVGGKALSPEDLARQTGGDPGEVKRLLKQLESAGVFSRDSQGIIYSRRAVRDIAESARKSAAGKLGGNPLLKQAVKQRRGSSAPDSLKPIFQKPEATTTTKSCRTNSRTEAAGFSLAQVKAAFAEVGRSELANEFFDYNEARGWEKVRDLSAMTRLFIRRHEERQAKRTNGTRKRSHPAKPSGNIPYADGCQPR